MLPNWFLEKKEKTILLVRPDVMGDVILISPLIQSIKLTWPESKLILLVQDYTKDIYHNHPDVDQIFLDPRKKHKNSLGYVAYIKQIKQLKLDMVIHCYFEPYYAYLMALARVPIRIGDSQKIGLRPTINYPAPMNVCNILNHEIDLNIALLVFHYPDLKVSQKLTLFTVESDDVLLVERLSKLGVTTPYIVIHPTTGRGNREWGEKRYSALIKQISKELELRIVLTGSQADFKKNESILSLSEFSDNCVNLAGKTTVKELKSVIKNALLIIGTDTGPTHMAAAFSRPVLSISPTKYVKSLRWGPFQTPHYVVGYPQKCLLVCNPHQCQLPDCLDFISVNNVYTKLKNLLNAPNLLSLAHQRLNWLKQSLRIGVYVDGDNLHWEHLDEYFSKLNQEALTYYILVPNIAVKNRLLKTEISSEIIVVSQLFKWVKTVQSRDINLIDSRFSSLSKQYLKLVSLLSAPKLSVPPVIVYQKESYVVEKTQLEYYYEQINLFWSKTT